MKAKILCISLILIAMLMSSCTAKPPSTPQQDNNLTLSKRISSETKWEINQMDNILKEVPNVPIKDLKTHSFSEMSRYVGIRFLVLEMGSIGTDIIWFNNVARKDIENIQKIDDNHIAVVYKVAEEGYDETFMFIVFERSFKQESNREIWKKTGEAYFLNKVYNIEDFKSINVGESVESLYDIDKSIHYDVMRRELSGNVAPTVTSENISSQKWVTAPKMIYKLLKDGIMTIEYKLDSLTITEINYYPYANKVLPYGVTVSNHLLLNCLTVNN